MPPGEKYPSLQTPNPTPVPSVGSTSNCQNKERRRREFVIFRPLETTRSGSSNLSWWSRDSTLQARGGTAGVGKRAAQFSPPCERECFDVGQLVLINSTCPPFLMGGCQPSKIDRPTNLVLVVMVISSSHYNKPINQSTSFRGDRGGRPPAERLPQARSKKVGENRSLGADFKPSYPAWSDIAC